MSGFRIAEAFVEVKASDDGLRDDVRRKVEAAGAGQDIKVGLKVDKGTLGGLMANLAPFILPAVGAVGQLTGVLGLVPAVAGAAGTAYGALKVGLSGFSDALKNAKAAKNTQELNAALADLSPNARVAALAVHNLEPAWNNLHLDVQQRLFQGVGKDIQRVGVVDLPVLRRGLDATAGALNQGVHYFTSWATSSKTVGDLRAIMDNSAVSTQNLMRALQPVLSIVRDIATVGSSMLPGLSSGLANAAQRAADFVSHARETGKLKEWIQTGIDATGQLFHILGDLVKIIVKIGTAPPLFGMGFLSALSTVTDLVLKLITDFPQLIPMIEAALVVWRAWTIAQWALNVAMDANPIGLVIGIIAALVAAVILVTGHLKDFTGWMVQVGTSIVDAVLPVLKQLWDQIKTQVIPAFEAFIVALGPLVDFFVRILAPVVKATWDAISSTIRSAITIITGILQAFTGLLTGNWSLFWTGIENILRGAWQVIQGVIGAALNLVLGLFGTSTTQIRNDWNSFWNGVSSTASSVWNSVTGFLTNSMNSFRGFFSGVWNGIVGDFQNIWGRVTGIATSVWQAVYGAFRDGINQIIRFINGLVDDADIVLKFLLIPQIPHVPALAGGGTVGGGFTTNGPMAIVGEGNQCIAHGTMIETEGGRVPIEAIEPGQCVVTRNGYRLVSWSGLTRPAAEVLCVRTASGEQVVCTPDHLIWAAKGAGHGDRRRNRLGCGTVRGRGMLPCHHDEVGEPRRVAVAEHDGPRHGAAFSGHRRLSESSRTLRAGAEAQADLRSGHCRASGGAAVDRSILAVADGATFGQGSGDVGGNRGTRRGSGTPQALLRDRRASLGAREHLHQPWGDSGLSTLQAGARPRVDAAEARQRPDVSRGGESERSGVPASEARWVEARDLTPGDLVWTLRFDCELHSSIVLSITPAERVDTYDLTVEDDHEFIAGGILVHNSHPEYVIPTDPAHRSNALALYQSLGAQLMASGGILGKVESWVGGAALGPLNGAVDLLANAIPAGMFRNIATSIGHSAVGAIKSLVEKAVAATQAAASAAGVGFSTFAGSGSVAGWIQAAIAATGVPATWAGPMNTLIMRESGGNPNAINRTDSNAAAGHPSQGLTQTIPSTFSAYHQPGTSWNITDPVANIAASFNYIKARYGSIFNVQQANASLPPKGYDLGGIASGMGLMPKYTNAPERVLSPAQTAAFDRLVDILGRGGGRAGGVTVNVTQTAGSPAETGRFVALALRTVG